MPGSRNSTVREVNKTKVKIFTAWHKQAKDLSLMLHQCKSNFHYLV